MEESSTKTFHRCLRAVVDSLVGHTNLLYRGGGGAEGGNNPEGFYVTGVYIFTMLFVFT